MITKSDNWLNWEKVEQMGNIYSPRTGYYKKINIDMR